MMAQTKPRRVIVSHAYAERLLAVGKYRTEPLFWVRDGVVCMEPEAWRAVRSSLSDPLDCTTCGKSIDEHFGSGLPCQ